MLSNKKMLTNTTASPSRVAGTKRSIHELFDDLTLTVKTKKPKTNAEEEAPISAEAPLPSILDDDLSLELSSMSMSSSSSSSSPSSSPPQKKLPDLDDDALRHIGSFLTPKHRRALALTCHDAHRACA